MHGPGILYLPTFVVDFYGFHVGVYIYTIHGSYGKDSKGFMNVTYEGPTFNKDAPGFSGLVPLID